MGHAGGSHGRVCIGGTFRIAALALLCLLVTATAAVGTIYLELGDLGDGPYYLTAEGETYILTCDVTARGSAFVFAARDVTLDLNGHTVSFGTSPERYRYGVAAPPAYPHGAPMWAMSDIRLWRHCEGATIRNGVVIQAGQGSDCAAVISRDESRLTVEGIAIEIRGDDTFAMQFNDCADLLIHDNVIRDHTEVVSNRHTGRAAIDVMNAREGSLDIHDNVIHNCRQWGIRVSRCSPAATWGHIRDNQIFPNTIVSNGYGIGVHGDLLEVCDNLIAATNGRGIHLELCDRAHVHDNQIQVIEQPFWEEYDRVTAHGIKLEQCTRADVHDNQVVSSGLANSPDAVGNAAPLSIGVGAASGNYVHDNTFIARHLGGTAFEPSDYNHFATAIEFVGMGAGSALRIEDNQFVTQDRHFSSNTWKGPFYPLPLYAGDVVIRNNAFSRELTPAPTRKHDVFFMSSALYGLRFADNAGGDFRDFGTGWPWLSCAWGAHYSGTIRTVTSGELPLPGILVEVRDCSGVLVAAPTTDEQGQATLCLTDFGISTHGHYPDTTQVTECNPYSFTAAFAGGPLQLSAVIDRPAWTVTLRADPAGFGFDPTHPSTARGPELRLEPPTLINVNCNIRFTLPDRGLTRLELFGSDGRRIALLLEAPLDRGEHLLARPLDRVPTGVHLLRLQWAGRERTSRILVVR